MKSLVELKRKHFPKGIKRGLSNYKNKVFNRTTEKKLVARFTKLGIEEGSVICVHAMLSGLGYLPGGPESVIKAIKRAIPSSTIMMPTFPFDGTTEEYLSSAPIYHRDRTPSKSGLLSEALRRMPGSERSYHPTHPCVALGPKANYLINGSEQSITPFGDDSSYGRFSQLDDAVLLLIHTNNSSLVHRIQEVVHVPNLFLQDVFIAKGHNYNNDVMDYKVRIHAPKIPLFLVLPGDDEDSIEYIWMPDYSFLFPEYNKIRILNRLKSEKAKKILLDRHRYFIDEGVYKSTRINDAEIMVVSAKPWLKRVYEDVKENIKEFSEYYSIENMKRALEQGLLTK